MSNSSTFSLIVKIAAGGLLLAILLLILGTTAAVDVTTSILIIGGIVGLFAAVLMGKNIWWLLVFFAVSTVRLPGNLSTISPLSLGSVTVIPFLLALSVAGRINLKWNKLWFLDISLLVFVSLYINSYLRHPVSISILGFETEEVGGSGYVLMILATLTYIACSLIRTDIRELCRVLGYSVWVAIAFIFFNFAEGAYIFSHNEALQGGEAIDEGRVTVFGWSACSLIVMILCRYSLKNIFLSVWRLPVLIVCMVFALMVGGRIQACVYILSGLLVFFFKKKIGVLIVSCVVGYASLLLMSETGIIKEMVPGSIQRSISFVPGVEVRSSVRKSADGTVKEWRYVVWSMAFEENKSFSYIRNRMWGDGFGVKRQYLRQQNTILQRGGIYGTTDMEFFALEGVWHNGAITTIHRLGYVGLCVTVWLMISMFYVFYRATRSMINRKNGYMVPYMFIPHCAIFIVWGISHYSQVQICSAVAYAGLAKLIYTTALREKTIEPLWTRHRYVPLMLRESAVPHGELQGTNHIVVS